LNIIGSQIKLWGLEKIDDAIQSEKIEFQIQTKEELSKHLLYFRTCMKLELDRKINDCDLVNTASLLEKKVCLLDIF